MSRYPFFKAYFFVFVLLIPTAGYAEESVWKFDCYFAGGNECFRDVGPAANATGATLEEACISWINLYFSDINLVAAVENGNYGGCQLEYDGSGAGDVRFFKPLVCRYPFEWSSSEGACITHCPSHSTGFDHSLGECITPVLDEPEECDAYAGNPINLKTGEKIQLFDADVLVGNGSFPIEISRTYRSLARPHERQRAAYELAGRPQDGSWQTWYQPADYRGPATNVGNNQDPEHMIHSYSQRIFPASDGNRVFYRGPTGELESIDATSGQKQFSGGLIRQLSTGWEVFTKSGVREEFSAEGFLVKLEHPSGAWQQLEHDGHGEVIRIYDDKSYEVELTYRAGLLKSIELPDGSAVTYMHDDQGRLRTVTFPGGEEQETYLYEDNNNPFLLTAIVDANGARFAEWSYDDQGRAISSHHAGGAEQTQITYHGDRSASVTNSQGHVKTVHFSPIDGRITRVVGGSCSSVSLNAGERDGETSYSYGDSVFRTDESGAKTRFDYSAGGLLNLVERAFGTALSQKIRLEWHSVYQKPTVINYPDERSVRYTYGQQGRVEQVIETSGSVERVTKYRYDARGLLIEKDGPRTDVDDTHRYSYDSRQRLVRTINPMGQATEVLEFDANGRPTRVQDENGVVTDLEYDARGRIIRHQTADRKTLYDYDKVGQLTRVSQSDGPTLRYEYDAARRLTVVESHDGERIEFEHDAMGNISAKRIRDGAGTLVRKHNAIFDELGRLKESVSADGRSIYYQYDVKGNLVSSRDELNHETRRAYDLLGRLSNIWDPLYGETAFTYDAANNLISVTDPRGVTTKHEYNFANEVVSINSPDSGTVTFERDEAGNIVKKADSRGKVTLYTYDALNRLIQVQYPGNPEEGVSYSYDDTTDGNYGVGRLTGIADRSGGFRYSYDSRGNVVQELRIVEGESYRVGYNYDLAGRLTRMVYPSGRVVNYEYSGAGKLLRVTTAPEQAGTQVTVIDHIAFMPFGPLKSMSYGNGFTRTQDYNQAYELTRLFGSVIDRSYFYGGTGNIERIQDHLDAAGGKILDYDAMSRLVRAKGAYGLLEYDYDPVGNRIVRRQMNGGDTRTETYDYASDSNRLVSIGETDLVHDIAGNRIEQGPMRYQYDHANRLTRVERDGRRIAEYRYNSQHQRTLKTVYQNNSSRDGEQQRLREAIRELQVLLGELSEEQAAIDAQFALLNQDGDELRKQAAELRESADVLLTQAEASEQQARVLSAQANSLRLRASLSFWDAIRAADLQAQADAIDAQANTRKTRAAQALTQAEEWLNDAADYDTQAQQYDDSLDILRGQLLAQLDDIRELRRRHTQAIVDKEAELLALATTQPGNATSTTTHFFYDLKGKLIAEANDQGEITREYFWLGDMPLALQEDGQLFKYHVDHLNTPQALTDSEQRIVWAANYLPFGKASEIIASVRQPLRFPGQYHDAETGLHYNWHRYYEPATGRYLQSDPIGLEGGINTYGYALQNPILYTDPLGLKTVPCPASTVSPGVPCWITVPDDSGISDGPYPPNYCPSGDCAAFPASHNSNLPSSCQTKCTQNYAGGWAVGVGIGTAYTAVGGPAGLAYAAGSIGLAGGTTAYAACMKACEDNNNCSAP